jgi:hypothetical protein
MNQFQNIVFKTIVLLVCCSPLSVSAGNSSTAVPPYVLSGLAEYGTNGYKAAVQTWLSGSPHENATTMASNIAFFVNFEKLAGTYRSYDILMIRETMSSNVTYVRMNYERLPCYVLFSSIKRGDSWVLGRIRLDRMQRFGSAQ